MYLKLNIGCRHYINIHISFFWMKAELVHCFYLYPVLQIDKGNTMHSRSLFVEEGWSVSPGGLNPT